MARKSFKFVYIPADMCDRDELLILRSGLPIARPHRRCRRLLAAIAASCCRLPRCRDEPLQQWEQELLPGKEVECLIDRLKVH